MRERCIRSVLSFFAVEFAHPAALPPYDAQRFREHLLFIFGSVPPATAAERTRRLKTSGFVDIEGTRYEAYCRSGHAMRGAALTVVDVDNFRVVVSEPKSS